MGRVKRGLESRGRRGSKSRQHVNGEIFRTSCAETSRGRVAWRAARGM